MISPTKPYTIYIIIILALYFILTSKSIKKIKEKDILEDTKEKSIDEIKKIIPYYKENKRFLRKLQNNENKIIIKIKGQIEQSVKIFHNTNISPHQVKVNNQTLSNIENRIRLVNESTTIEMVWNQPLTSVKQLFYGCSAIESIDFSNANFSEVSDASGLMQSCSNLKYVNCGNADLRKAESISNMFSSCYSLEKVDNFFKTYNVKNTEYLFSECNVLTSIDLSNLYTPFVTNIKFTINKCPNLESIELPNLDTTGGVSGREIHCFFSEENIKVRYINLLNYSLNTQQDNYIIDGLNAFWHLIIYCSKGSVYRNIASLTNLCCDESQILNIEKKIMGVICF